ncbi:30s ribosomal protein s4 [Quercus suber]|uniref:Small ribosomal subunit protein uS4c n=1 Tax=Quercus suber TaxID=58331 RepID=A0AAW0II26_QUESU
MGRVLLQLLEMRLDNILFRLGMALTISQALQLVNHGHILVNGRIVDIPSSYCCKPQDIITARDEQKSRALIQNCLDSSLRDEELQKHLTFHPFQYK